MYCSKTTTGGTNLTDMYRFWCHPLQLLLKISKPWNRESGSVISKMEMWLIYIGAFIQNSVNQKFVEAKITQQ